jgi:hypothetical protein
VTGTILLDDEVMGRPLTPCGRTARAWWTALGALLAGVAACQAGGKSAEAGSSGGATASTAAAGESAGRTGAQAAPGEWVALFDGKDLSHWRGYKRQDVPSAWKVEGDSLAFVPSDDKNARGDLVTRDQYGDFEFACEWKISPVGNSGVIYRFDENHQFPWETGPEMQVLDNTKHPDGKNPLTSAGADYALYPPSADVTRPVGEWNEARIVARGPHVEHWLNGQKVVEYEQGSPDWRQRVEKSKFKTMPDYGKQMSGHIALQDHGDRVWYRNVRIRRLGGGQ